MINQYLLELYTYYLKGEPFVGAVTFLGLCSGIVMMSPPIYAAEYDYFADSHELRPTSWGCLEAYTAYEGDSPNRAFYQFQTAEHVFEFLKPRDFINAPQLVQLFIRWYV